MSARLKISFFILLLLTSCASSITEDGLQVRQINPDDVNDCKFIGIVETKGRLSYSSTPEAKREIHNRLRNETALLGGNAFAITEEEAEKGFSKPTAKANAYDCP